MVRLLQAESISHSSSGAVSQNALHRFSPASMFIFAVAPKRGRFYEAFPAKHSPLWRRHVGKGSVGALRTNLLDEVRRRRRKDVCGGDVKGFGKAVLQCLQKLQ